MKIMKGHEEKKIFYGFETFKLFMLFMVKKLRMIKETRP